MKALVVFHDHGVGWLSRLLKPGFRHVFAVVRDDNYWISIDGKAGVPLFEVVVPSDYDLAAFYRRQGFTVIETRQRNTAPRSPFAIANCVGLVKAALAIRSTAITPWGLHEYLRRRP